MRVTDAADASSWVSLQLAPAKTPVGSLPPVPGVGVVPIPEVATAAGKIADASVPNQISYPDPLAGVDVSYAATGEAVKETTTLSSLASVDALPGASLAYTVQTAPGLSVATTADGGLNVTGAKGAVVFTVPPSFMDDAMGEHSAAVTATLAADKSLTSAAANAWTLTLTPDHGWLAAKERAWPVLLDPSVVIGAPSAMEGCTIRSDTPTTSDCAGSEILTSVNGANSRRALLNFDTLLDVIPANAVMAVAYLNLWLPSAAGSPSSNVDISAVTKPWTTAATWNKYDSANNWALAGGDKTAPYERYPFAASGAYQSAQVTRLVQQWAEDEDADDNPLRSYGFILQKTGTDTTAITHLGSPSSANPPTLYVEWDPRTGVRKGNAAAVNEQLSDHTGVSVNPATGNAAVTTKEFSIAGMGVDLNVAHTSQSLDTGGIGPQGYGWTSSLHGQRLTFYNGGTAANAETMFYTDGAGAQWTFLRNKRIDTTWIRPRGLDMDLIGIGGGAAYQLTDRKSQTVILFKNIGDATTNVFGADTITDRNGNKITFSYDPSVRSTFDNTLVLRSVMDTRGRVMTVSNPGADYDSSITDSASRAVVYTGSSSQLDQFTDAAGGLVKYGYDSGHRVNKVTTPSGQVTEMTYDATGRIQTLKRDDPVTPANSPLWQFSYTAFTRDSSGRPTTLTTVTDPNGHTTVYKADGRGRILKVTNGVGKDAAKTYSPNDDVTTSTGRTAGGAGPETTTSTYEPSTAGDTFRLASTKAPTGAQSFVNTYGTGSALYNPAKTTDEQANATSYTYDTAGNKITTARPDGKTEYTLYEGDSDPAYGGIVHCGLSGAATKTGAICETRDALYTAGTSRASTPAHRTAYEYDAQGQLATLHPPGSPGGAGTLADQTFTFDSLSRLKTVTDGNAKTTTYTYDAMDRITKILHADGSYEMNDFGGASSDGWQVSLKEYTSGGTLTRTTTYSRDFMGRLTGTSSPEGTLGMGHDKADNLISYTDNSGTTAYAYNNADQLTSLTMPTGSCSGLTYASPGTNTGNGCILFKLDDDGRRTGIEYPGANLIQAITRDDSGRITQIIGKSGGSAGTERVNVAYSYTDTGSNDRALIQKVIDGPAGGGTAKTTAYTYDPMNELTFAKTTGGATSSEQFCYSGTGNRTYYYRNGAAAVGCGTGTPAATDTFNSANQLTGATGVTPAGTALAGTAFAYDGNGAETAGISGIGRTATYGDRGQATSFTPAGGSAITQSYSGTGNASRVTSGTTTFMPSPLAPGPAWSKTGSNTTWTVRDPNGQLLAIRVGVTTNPASGTTYHPFTDNLGNVRAMTTASGTTPDAAYTYSAYGYTLSTSGTLVQPYRWGSGYTDDATGLIKLGLRYYDPAHGRFTQQDPTGKDQYPYSYGSNCANNFNDPGGAFSIKKLLRQGLKAAQRLSYDITACFNGGAETVAAFEPVIIASGELGPSIALAAGTYGCGAGIIANEANFPFPAVY